MKNVEKGGIASVIVVIIMVGIVLALIISTVIPMAQESRDTAQIGVDSLDDLQDRMGGAVIPGSPDPAIVPPGGGYEIEEGVI